MVPRYLYMHTRLAKPRLHLCVILRSQEAATAVSTFYAVFYVLVVIHSLILVSDDIDVCEVLNYEKDVVARAVMK
jgi:hypothetical protein